jgi:hypothetical protein
MTDLSTTFSNSRMFPGHCQLTSAFMVSLGTVSMFRSMRIGAGAKSIVRSYSEICLRKDQ